MESNRNSDAAPYEQIDLFKIFDHIRLGIRRLFWLAPILIAVFAAAGYFYAKHTYVPSYTAYASFVVSADTPYGGSQSYYNRTTASQLSKTFPYIISSGVLKQVVAEDLGVTSIPATISAESTLESALFTLKATSNDPQSAYNVLQSVIENYPKVAEYIIGSTQLTKLDESGVPTEPSNPPDFWSYAGIGAAAGAVLTLLIMYVYSLTRKTVRSEDDLKEQISVTSLGALPFAPLKRRRKSNDRSLLLTRNIVDEMIGDPMRMIRTRLVVELEREEIRSFMVTSSLPGEGKTTMIRLILGLVQPDSGIAVLRSRDGTEVPMNAESRCFFSYVPQGNAILSGTVAENLRMVREDATDEDIIEALKLACAWDFVSKLPDGINSKVGERGRGFSEGQAQRIAIARAILRDAPILLLDEATSALDVATERQVLRNIIRQRPNKTCIVTTHRPTVLNLCQRVYRVMDTRVTELSEEESSRMSMDF